MTIGLKMTKTEVGPGLYRFDVYDATPNGVVTFVYGTQMGTVLRYGVTLAEADPVPFMQGVVDPAGHAMALLVAPSTLKDRTLYVQAFEQAPTPATTRVSVVNEMASLWHNPALACDVTGDGLVTPLDVLVTINYINLHGPGPLSQSSALPGGSPMYVDVDGNRDATASDVLLVVNFIQLRSLASGEGELGPLASAATALDFRLSDASSILDAVAYQVPLAVPDRPADRERESQLASWQKVAIAADCIPAAPAESERPFRSAGALVSGPPSDGDSAWSELEDILPAIADAVAQGWA